MNLEHFIAFVIAAEIVLIIPGPTIILVVSQAIAHGRRAVVPLVVGVSLGDLTAMTFSLLGLGAVMAASAALFAILKWIGAIYLVYLGIRLWRSDPHKRLKDIPDADRGRSLSRGAFIVTALNPKSIAFFVAFLPQFIHPQHSSGPQLVLLGATFLVLATVNAALYAIFAGQLRDILQSARVQRWFDRCGGSALIGAGIFTATLKHT